ncbi:hypothetical protein AGMMS4952_26330 [Spirochaetia bacterium]|nr:hypothetical protein AGMMS4952_26330 [Spirochaetia bacterium]
MEAFKNLMEMAKSCTDDKQYEKAIELYDKAIEVAPDDESKEFIKAEQQKVVYCFRDGNIIYQPKCEPLKSFEYFQIVKN